MLLEVYRCVQLKRCSVVCGCVLHRGQRGEGWCVLHRGQRGEGWCVSSTCVGMILGWDFYWF